MKVIIAAGGTGGHISPALALHDTLVGAGHDVSWLTDSRGERYLQSHSRINAKQIDSGGLVSGAVHKRAMGLIKLIRGYWQAKREIVAQSPHVVVGFGGYPSVTPLMAAQRNGIPTILHEQNSVFGRANQFVAKRCTVVATSFANTEGVPDNQVHVGNPVSEAIAEIGRKAYRPAVDGNSFNILILGGSLGAKAVTDDALEAFALLNDAEKKRLKIVHQVRDEDQAHAKEVYAAHGISAEIASFFNDVPERLKQAHLVIARSGATTVAECAAAGRPTIFIPATFHQDLQQVKNASAVADAGGAWIHRSDLASGDSLAKLVSRLMSNPQILRDAAAKAQHWSRPQAVHALMHLVEQSAKS